MTMSPPTIFVWRVRLLLLAMAMGLSVFGTGKSPVQRVEAVAPLAARPSGESLREPAPALRAHRVDSIVSGPASGIGHLEMTKLVAPQAARTSCSSRSSARSQQLQGARPCKSAASRAGSKASATVHKQKFSSVRSLKKHNKLAAVRKGGPGPVVRTAAKSSGKTTVAAAKSRHGAANKANG